MTLSKSDYMLFLKHPSWLWLKKYDKHKLPPIDDNLQAIFDAGNEFETWAEKLYPNAIKVGLDRSNFYETYITMPSRTKMALDEGATTIFQGRFEEDGITCIFDMLEKVEDKTYDLSEIKSSTKAKPEHKYDLAFQVIVLEKFGINIRKIFVVHVNNEYVRDGNINPKKLIAKTDVTEAVKVLIDPTKDNIKKAFEVMSHSTIPDISPRHVNQVGVPGTSWLSDWLDIYKYINPDLDPYSIYFLSSLKIEQVKQLEDKKISLIKNISDELALNPRQLAQIQTTKDNKRIIVKKNIKDFLGTLTYPLYFLDYETFSSVIPKFDGCQPYKDYPFQYSLHILEKPGAKLKHKEYVHQERSNPMPQLLKKLKADIGKDGTVLTWNMSYEKGCNDRMGNLYPEYKELLKKINERVLDLMTPFSNMWLVDKKLFGSASLKYVLPALAPELSYNKLEISDGMKARNTWTKTFLGGENHNQREKIASDLSNYCTLDTLAMVQILKKLQQL